MATLAQCICHILSFRMGCLSKLRHLPDHSDQAEFVALLETMCLWEMAPDVLQMISDWLADIIVLKKPVEKSQKTLVFIIILFVVVMDLFCALFLHQS